MGSTTPIYALPYPVGTDLIMDGDNAIEALARRVEALLGSSLGVPSGRRNVIRNGDMGVTQRGLAVAGTTGDRFAADGWKAYAVGGSQAVAVQPASVGQFTGADGARYHINSNVTGQSATGDAAQVYQRVEDVRTLAGRQVTFSAMLEGAAGTKISVEVVQNFGSGGSPSPAVSTFLGVITLAGGAARRYSLTAALPSVASKVVGSGGDHVQVTMWLSAGAGAAGIGIQNAAVNITDVQLEAGAVATPFERLSQQAQLAWCHRYYWRFTGAQAHDVVGQGCAVGAATGYIWLLLPVQMRAIPTTILPVSGWMMTDRMAEWGVSSASVSAASVRGIDINPICNGAAMTPRAAMMLYTNAAGPYVECSAEL